MRNAVGLTQARHKYFWPHKDIFPQCTHSMCSYLGVTYFGGIQLLKSKKEQHAIKWNTICETSLWTPQYIYAPAFNVQNVQALLLSWLTIHRYKCTYKLTFFLQVTTTMPTMTITTTSTMTITTTSTMTITITLQWQKCYSDYQINLAIDTK